MRPLNPYEFRQGPIFFPQIAPILGGDPFMEFIPQLMTHEQQQQLGVLQLPAAIQHVAPFTPPGLVQMYLPPRPPRPPHPTFGQFSLPSGVIQQFAPFAPPGLQQTPVQPTAPAPMPGHNPGNPGHHFGNPGHYGSNPYCGCKW